MNFKEYMILDENTKGKGDLSKFNVGDTVILTRAKHKDFSGEKATVTKLIKSRNTVVVKVLTGSKKGQTYDAFPENIDLEKT